VTLAPGRLRALDPESVAASPPPALGAVGERLYAALDPLAWLDEEYGWALATLTGSVGSMFDAVDTLARDTADGPGWSLVLDLTRCPDAWLPWLGQFVGVEVPVGSTAAAARHQIEDLSGFGRGRREAIVAAAQATLTGTKTVYIQERYGGDAYVLAVRTLTPETPSSAATLAAVLAQKPGGIVLDFGTSTANTYDATRVKYATYDALKAAVPNYSALTTG
jgi:hypothetical protein